MIGRFDDARPRRVGVRHVDGEKLRGRAYAEERHLFSVCSLLLLLCAFYVNGIFGAFRMCPRRRSEEKERKHLEDDDDDKLMNDNNDNDNNETRDDMNNNNTYT